LHLSPSKQGSQLIPPQSTSVSPSLSNPSSQGF